MSDRETLLLAAKAAGLGPVLCYEQKRNCLRIGTRDSYRLWRPLSNAGDLLGLVIATGIIVNPDRYEQRTIAEYGDGEQCMRYWHGLGDIGEVTATHAAVVQAAAEIGRSML